MTDEEIKEICYRVFAEVDLDGDNRLTVGEFAAFMGKIEGFGNKFVIQLT